MAERARCRALYRNRVRLGDLPDGCLWRNVGGAGGDVCHIEHWARATTPGDSAKSAPLRAGLELPPPTRVEGFEAAVLELRPDAGPSA